MSRTLFLIGCAALVALTVLPATAETTRSLGMGDVGLALPNTGSWYINPALLPDVNGFASSTSPWPATAEFTAALGDDVANIQFVDISVRDAAGTRGFGAGYANIMGAMDIFGAGYGQRLSFLPGLSGGINVYNIDVAGVDETMFDLGLSYEAPMTAGNLLLGLAVWDISNQVDTNLAIGGAWDMPGNGITLAADLIDLGGADVFNVGAEWARGPLSVRVGASDGDLTAGFGYIWRNFAVGFAWQDWGAADAYFGSASAHF